MVGFHVGVLAVQGGFKEAFAALQRQPGVVAHEVRTPAELARVDALVLPGGESTAMGHLLELSGLLAPLREFVVAQRKPVFGICAGLILLADAVAGDLPAQPLVGGLDATVSRNHFGRQGSSRFRRMALTDAGSGLGAASHFIRAPALIRTGDAVTVLATVDTVAVAVRQENILAVAFHPETHHDDSYLRFFLTEVCGVQATLDKAANSANSSSSSSLSTSFEVVPSTSNQHHQQQQQQVLADGSTRASVAPPMVSVGTPVLPTTASETEEAAVLTSAVKRAFPIFQQGGVIMDVVNAEQARIAEDAGAVAVMALERIPADIKKDGGLARMSDPAMILEVMDATSLPVMAKARIGHFAEARVLEALDVDCIDESEVLTPADETHHIDKRGFSVPFVCGAKNLGEALRRIAEGASMIRVKGNAGTGNVVQAVRHARTLHGEIRHLQSLRPEEVFVYAKEHQVPVELVEETRAAGRLPVVTFAAGGLATPADVSLLMHLGCDGVFVGSGIFKGENPAARARAMVQACTHFNDARLVARVSTGLGKAMVGILDHGEKYAAMGVNSDDTL